MGLLHVAKGRAPSMLGLGSGRAGRPTPAHSPWAIAATASSAAATSAFVALGLVAAVVMLARRLATTSRTPVQPYRRRDPRR